MFERLSEELVIGMPYMDGLVSETRLSILLRDERIVALKCTIWRKAQNDLYLSFKHLSHACKYMN